MYVVIGYVLHTIDTFEQKSNYNAFTNLVKCFCMKPHEEAIKLKK